MLPPLVFEPYFRPQVWGGTQLQSRLGKRLPPGQCIGESWEISAHPLHVSRVANGEFCGASLSQLWGLHRREFLGLRGSRRDLWHDRQPFPLLVKLLDCNDWLSVQVHPNDMAARELLGEPNGKTEAWVVLHAEPGSRIFAGLQDGVRRRDLEEHLDRGTVADCMYSFEPQPGDCLLIEAGTVHAVGGGVLLAEVQQTSDATFRLFDWNRVDAQGRSRELHREAALQCINFGAGLVEPIRSDLCGGDNQPLISCDHFTIDSVTLRNQSRSLADEPLTLWLVISGTAQLTNQLTDHEQHFSAGETVLIPAESRPLTWSALDATLLRIEPLFETCEAASSPTRSRELVAV